MPQATKIMLKKKNGKFRNKVALCLKTWRTTGSIKETSKITGINRATVKTCLECSKFYLKSPYCHKNYNRKILCENEEIKDVINKKNSLYRKNIAAYLREWKKAGSALNVARKFNVTLRMAYYVLRQSVAYRRRYSYKRNCSIQESRYINRWAKKIKAARLLGGKCEICGNTNIFNLDFHHKNKKDKIDRVSCMLIGKWKNIQAEALKCRLLCRNCHRELHNQKQKNKKGKKKLLEIMHETKCSRCSYDKNLSALEFHHTTKDKTIELCARCYVGGKIHVDKNKKLLKELKKCIVLCANCHNETHNNVKQFKKLKKKINIKILDLN